MNSPLEPSSGPSTNLTKPLWVAVAVLAAAVLAMGGELIYNHVRAAATPLPTAVSVPDVVTAPPVAANTNDLVEKQAPARVTSPEPNAKPLVRQPPARVVIAHSAPPAASGYVVTAPPVTSRPTPRAICTICGTVESVRPVELKGKATGLGAIGGGVLGAVIGNQFGGGNGRAATTILGAVGGGFAGNAIEKNVRKTTAYEITVRMENGSMRHFQRSTPVAVGARVRLEGNTLHLADESSGASGG